VIMVFFNYALRKLNAKIVYYGPGLCGKTTNLQWIHDHFEGGHRGEMISLATEGDRTIFFDLLPLEIGKIRGLDVTLQLYTVPGQVHYNSTRQLVLKGADGVVFVADSQRAMRTSNAGSWGNLKENLLLQGIELETFPHVLQFNKRDLRDILSLEELDETLNEYDAPFFESVATEGIGVQETLQGIVKLVMRSLRDRYEPVGQEEQRSSLRPAEAGAPVQPSAASPAPVAPFRPPAPDASLAPPAGRESPVEAAPRTEVSEEAVTHPSMKLPSVEDSGHWDETPPRFEPPGVPLEDGNEAPSAPVEQEDRSEMPATEELAEPSAVEAAVEEPGSQEGGSGMEEAPALAHVADTAPPEPFEMPAAPTASLNEEETAPFMAPWADQPSEESATPEEDSPEEARVEDAGEEPGEGASREEFPAAAAGEPVVREETALEPEKGGEPFQEPVVVPAEVLAQAVPDEVHPVRGVVEEPEESPGIAEDGEAVSPPPGADELLRQALESSVGGEEQALSPSQSAGDGGPTEDAAVPEQPEPEDRPASDQEAEPASGIKAEEAAGNRPIEPVVFGSDDPFGFVEEAREAAVTAEASAVVAVPVEGGRATRSDGPSNQLQLQIEGTRALARSGDVRELDIHVPVPGHWIGNHRVTLQLRLTLVPTEEDQ